MFFSGRTGGSSAENARRCTPLAARFSDLGPRVSVMKEALHLHGRDSVGGDTGPASGELAPERPSVSAGGLRRLQVVLNQASQPGTECLERHPTDDPPDDGLPVFPLPAIRRVSHTQHLLSVAEPIGPDRVNRSTECGAREDALKSISGLTYNTGLRTTRLVPTPPVNRPLTAC